MANSTRKGPAQGNKSDTWAKTIHAMSNYIRNSKSAARRRIARTVGLVVALSLLLTLAMEVGLVPGLGVAIRLATVVDSVYQAAGGRPLLPRATELPLGTLNMLKQAEAAAAANVTFYTVKYGDTLSGIAAAHGVSLSTVLQANGLDTKDIIRPGQRIAIPGTDGSLYTVKAGDSLWEIAIAFGSDVQSIKQANSLSSNIIYPGQSLVIPGVPGGAGSGGAGSGGGSTSGSGNGTRVTTAAVGSNGTSTQTDGGNGGGGASPAGAVTSAAAVAGSSPNTYRYEGLDPASVGVSGAGMIWPVYGALTSLYQWRWGRMHTGIDIAAPGGTAIRAAADGTVIYSGWLGGYGQAVQIRHADGKVTLYGHASTLIAKTGDHVKQGQVIARVGSTGNSTGPHLHFEVMVNGGYRDPLAYLATRALPR